MLSSAYIYEQIPVEIRPFFNIEMAEIEECYASLLDNIAASIRTIHRFARLNKTITLLIGSNPLEVSMSNAKLSVEILPPAAHISLGDLIFLDLNHLVTLPDPLQRVCSLEELAHSVMNVADEHLVKVMVAEMLPDIQYLNNQYVMR